VTWIPGRAPARSAPNVLSSVGGGGRSARPLEVEGEDGARDTTEREWRGEEPGAEVGPIGMGESTGFSGRRREGDGSLGCA
jgi:hypothetical protein